jgi:aryl-alcohol dehydrogenase-like predicted oxidoreductase
MKQVQFGESSFKVSQIGLGMAALGRPGYINLGHNEDLIDTSEEKMEAHARHMLQKAVDFGITYIDAAQSYGKAEQFLGRWLKDSTYGRHLNVGSKWGYYYTAKWEIDASVHEIKDHTIERLAQQWPESKERLGANLKLYQIHSATFESGVLENSAVLEKLEEIRHKGYVIGLSLSGPNQAEVLRDAMKVRIGGSPLFGSVQATFNLLEQAVRPALQKAYDNGLGVIVKEGLANGRLTSRNEEAFVKILASVAAKHQVSVDAIALAYIMQEDFVTTVLSGAATEAHLRSNVTAKKVALDMADLMVLSNVKMDSEKYWNQRSKLTWN